MVSEVSEGSLLLVREYQSLKPVKASQTSDVLSIAGRQIDFPRPPPPAPVTVNFTNDITVFASYRHICLVSTVVIKARAKVLCGTST